MVDQDRPTRAIPTARPDPQAPRAEDLLGAITLATRELCEREVAAANARRAREAAIVRAARHGLAGPEIAEAAGITKQAVHKLLRAQARRRQST